MRVRHRIPSIFTLSMVDVLCCSLGCVILLWLINLRDAKQHEDDSGAKLHDLTNQVAELEKDRAAVQAEADDRAAALRDLGQKWKDAAGRVVSLQADVAAREKDLTAVRGRSDDLSRQLVDAGRKLLAAQKETALRVQDLDDAAKKLTALQDTKARLETDLAGRDKELTLLRPYKEKWAADEEQLASVKKDLLASQGDLVRRAQALDDAAKSATALQASKTKLETDIADRNKELMVLRPYKDRWAADEEQLSALKKDVHAAQNDLARRTQDLDDVGKKFVALQLAKAKVEADLDDRTKELTLLRPYKDRAAADDDRVASLQKDLADARRNVVALQAEKATLQNQAARTRPDAENRFAGLALTGRRVVFLVDMSGSMVYLDDNTPAPQKWVEVHKTVARIMRSLPDLEKYQIVTFSDRPHFPLGGDGKWLDYDARTSADLVLQTLADVKPDGGTNMYTALETAFRYRGDGLDAIYLLSDGLPNLGEGVKPEEVSALTELERGARLSAFIRKTLKTDWNRDLPDRPRVHINTVGFFYESPDVGAFLWALARENDGGFVGMSRP